MTALNVRVRGRHRPEPPELFYQNLPPESITLPATIPACKVSIPACGSSWRGGRPFSELPAKQAANQCFPGGSSVVYQLQQDCNYAAVAVRENEHNYTLEEFIEIARRRTSDYFGNLEKIPDRHIYIAPDKEEWGSILRDDGYAALNSEKLSSREISVFAEKPSLETKRYGHAIRIRVPLYSGDKLPGRNPLSVFSRVEVYSENSWLDFDEYLNTRAGLTAVPAAIADCFSEWLAGLTKESGFDKWRFRPGTAFGERTEWWGLRCRRRTVHEGLDFVEGFRGGEISLIPEGVPVRSVASGELAAILDDFMGKTIVVRHPSLTQPDGKVFHTLLCHVHTEGSLPLFVNKGEILGRAGRRAGIRVCPHIHLTGAWFPAGFPFKEAGVGTAVHPGFTPAVLTNLNSLIETSPLCVISPDDRDFLADI